VKSYCDLKCEGGADVEATGGVDVLIILQAMWEMYCCALVGNVVVIFYYLFFLCIVWPRFS
jgi:hypothetical protein